MRFSIITPSFCGARWLPLALASVAEQGGVEVEQIVQDAGSDDGTAEILQKWSRTAGVQVFIEKDEGMYDAINRGMQRAQGEILAWLNCDEQYLPGTLARVAEAFMENPAADFVLSGAVIVDGDGRYICSRKILLPLEAHTRVCHLSTFSCAMFFRRRVIDEYQLFFDPDWKAAGDAEWMLRSLALGLKMMVLPGFVSTFTDHGENLGASEQSEEERNRLLATAPWWQRKAVPLIAAHHRLRRLAAGVYFQHPFSYSIYTNESPDQRVTFQVPRPTTVWKERLTLLR